MGILCFSLLFFSFPDWGFDDQYEGVVADFEIEMRENREERERERREKEEKEMTRYEVNGCFFCVKYMWENDTWGAMREKEENGFFFFFG